MKLLITIDVEGDNQWSAERRRNITTENAKYLPRFQELCEKYRFKPTYLTNYEMAKDEYFVEFAKAGLKNGTCEIGCHPHAWNSPPNYDLTGNDNKYMPYLIEYPEEIIYNKVKYLTDLLELTFEKKMVSHRAGRWGFNEVYARILDRLDYKVDCSVTPLVSWKIFQGAPNQDGGSNFSEFPSAPYFLDMNDISKHGKSLLLEIPVTIRANYGAGLNFIYELVPSRLVKRVFHLFFGLPFVWFRCKSKYHKYLIDMLDKELSSNSVVIEFMIHSSELMPGGSPYFKTEEQITNLYQNLNEIFELLSSRGVEGLTCSEFYSYYFELV